MRSSRRRGARGFSARATNADDIIIIVIIIIIIIIVVIVIAR
jgi:hypothetical protein